jgi:hypothetical protein
MSREGGSSSVSGFGVIDVRSRPSSRRRVALPRRGILCHRTLEIKHLHAREVVGQDDFSHPFEGVDGVGHAAQALVDLPQGLGHGLVVALAAVDDRQLELDRGDRVVQLVVQRPGDLVERLDLALLIALELLGEAVVSLGQLAELVGPVHGHAMVELFAAQPPTRLHQRVHRLEHHDGRPQHDDDRGVEQHQETDPQHDGRPAESPDQLLVFAGAVLVGEAVELGDVRPQRHGGSEGEDQRLVLQRRVTRGGVRLEVLMQLGKLSAQVAGAVGGLLRQHPISDEPLEVPLECRHRFDRGLRPRRRLLLQPRQLGFHPGDGLLGETRLGSPRHRCVAGVGEVPQHVVKQKDG